MTTAGPMRLNERAVDIIPSSLSAIPFTPATGRRLLALDLEAEAALARGAQQIADHHDISSVHINFLNQDAWSRLGDEDGSGERTSSTTGKIRVRFFRRFSGRAL